MQEFRIRKHPSGVFHIWQLGGGRYVRLNTPFTSRGDASQWVASIEGGRR